jgi:hypothetical protein
LTTGFTTALTTPKISVTATSVTIRVPVSGALSAIPGTNTVPPTCVIGPNPWADAIDAVRRCAGRFRDPVGRALELLSPRPDHPAPDLDRRRIRRRPVLGGLISEYERVA